MEPVFPVRFFYRLILKESVRTKVVPREVGLGCGKKKRKMAQNSSNQVHALIATQQVLLQQLAELQKDKDSADRIVAEQAMKIADLTKERDNALHLLGEARRGIVTRDFYQAEADNNGSSRMMMVNSYAGAMATQQDNLLRGPGEQQNPPPFFVQQQQQQQQDQYGSWDGAADRATAAVSKRPRVESHQHRMEGEEERPPPSPPHNDQQKISVHHNRGFDEDVSRTVILPIKSSIRLPEYVLLAEAPKITCDRCKGQGHDAAACSSRKPINDKMKCYCCRGLGHYASHCPSPKRAKH
jgi:hypothetical protein